MSVLTGLNSPDQCHLGLPSTPPEDGPRGSISAWAISPCLSSHSYACLQLRHCHTCAWPWTPLIWIQTCGPTSELDLDSISSQWNCPVMTGLCLTLVTITGPDPDVPFNFLAWPWICLITTNFPGDLDFWLNMATTPSPAPPALAGKASMPPIP